MTGPGTRLYRRESQMVADMIWTETDSKPPYYALQDTAVADCLVG